MKGVLQIVGVFFAGALVGFVLLGFGLSVNVSMMTPSCGMVLISLIYAIPLRCKL